MQKSTHMVAGLTAVLTALVPMLADAQEGREDWVVARTPHGHVTPLERPEAWVGKATLTDEEMAKLRTAPAQVTAGGVDAQFGDQLVLAALAGVTDAESYDTTGNYNQFWLADRDFDHNRTSLAIDPGTGRIPERTPDAVHLGRGVPPPIIAPTTDSWVDRPLSERCLTFGVPNLLAGYNGYCQILQSRDHLVILMEMIHDARIIPIDGPPWMGRQLHGDSRGHWKGDTLVVETTNFSTLGHFWNAGQKLRLTECFTPVGPDTLHHEITFDDDTT